MIGVPRLAFIACACAFDLACTRPIDVVSLPRDAGDEHAGDDSSSDAAVPTVACPGASVLVLASTGALYAFDPDSNAGKKVGSFTCPELGTDTVISIAVRDDGVAYALSASGLLLDIGQSYGSACNVWGKAPAPPSSYGAGLTIVGSATPTSYLGADNAVFRSDTRSPTGPSWTQVGSIDATDHVRALLGTGDGRIFAVLSPSSGKAYRVTRLAADTAVPGATLLIPTSSAAPDPEGPAGFALWGDALLVLMKNAVARYTFSTGEVGAPVMIEPFDGAVVAAASPPCASALR